MNVKLWKAFLRPVALANFPMLPCPKCDGSLKLNEETFKFVESSRQFDSKDFWDTDFEKDSVLGLIADIAKTYIDTHYNQGKFSAFLTCAKCRECVVMIGKGRFPNDLHKATFKKEVFHPEIMPEFFSPPVPLFNIPDVIPVNIKNELIRSFGFFHVDPSASGNCLRTMIERILDDLHIPNQNLHRRIESLYNQEPDLAETLMAIKWLGNDATHHSGFSKGDLLEAYEIIEHVLDELYVRKPNRKLIVSKSKAISKRYGKTDSPNETADPAQKSPGD